MIKLTGLIQPYLDLHQRSLKQIQIIYPKDPHPWVQGFNNLPNVQLSSLFYQLFLTNTHQAVVLTNIQTKDNLIILPSSGFVVSASLGSSGHKKRGSFVDVEATGTSRAALNVAALFGLNPPALLRNKNRASFTSAAEGKIGVEAARFSNPGNTPNPHPSLTPSATASLIERLRWDGDSLGPTPRWIWGQDLLL